MRTRTNKRAFTLIEMITVLGIIIIVLGIAIPVWNALMGGTNLAAAQNQIGATLANARADAVYNHKTIGVCFFVDPKTQRTAMAEVQVQPMWNGSGFTPLFPPSVVGAGNNGMVNAVEMVNNPDPTYTPPQGQPPTFNFYREIAFLPAGVGVALNNNTFTYNQYDQWRYVPNTLPPLDRYLRVGAIMFDASGQLTTIPYAIPLNDHLSSLPLPLGKETENLLCQRIGMFYSASTSDLASNVNSAGTPASIPLISSVGLVIYDRDVYQTQHASGTVQSRGTPTNIGDGAQFNDLDMNYFIYSNPSAPTTPAFQSSSADKFLEENWIDQNGIALMVIPSSGSLIRAR